MPSRLGNSVEVSTLVIKVASRCNMNCDYCYIYNGSDSSWREMPTVMSSATRAAVATRVHELVRNQQSAPNIVFHGGEPLLAGHRVLREFTAAILQGAPSAALSLQSNGTIYNDDVEALLIEYRNRLDFSISVDGFREENDTHRRGRSGRSVYGKIERTIARATRLGLLKGILVVVDPRSEPKRLIDFMSMSGVSQFNLILPDGDFDTLPYCKARVDSVETGEWLWRLFVLYASSRQSFRIEFFDDIARRLLLKSRGRSVPPATFSTCTLTVDTNGEIKQSDTFRINSDRADRLGDYFVHTDDLLAVANGPVNRRYLQRFETLPDVCNHCAFLDTCGGGYPSHRVRAGQFSNPSIYCADYLHLFERMEDALCA